MNKKIIKIVCLIVGIGSVLPAATVTWTGDGENWTNTTKWSGAVEPDGLPGGADTVVASSGRVVLDTVETVYAADFSGGQLDVLSGGGITTVDHIEVDRSTGSGALNIDGGSVSVGTTVFVSHYAGASGTLHVKNGGSISTGLLRSDGGQTAINLSGASSSITTTSGNNQFASTDKTTLNMSGGTFTTSGRDQWGGMECNLQISGGLYDSNGDQFHLQTRAGGTATLALSGGELDTAGNFYLNNAASSVGHVIQTDGALTLSGANNTLAIASGGGSEGTYEISGGTLDVSGTLQMNYGNDATFKVIGSDADIQVGAYLFANNAAATLSFVLDEEGVAVLETVNTAFIDGSALDVDLTGYDLVNGTEAVLVDSSSINGTFGTVNFVGGSADVDYHYDINGDGSDYGIALINIIPEPATMGLVAITSLLAFVIRRFRM